MNNNLSKEQLLLLQHNLTYEVYEKFMSLFSKDELLPKEQQQKNKYILEIMKDHPYWGEIKGWGDKRVYKNIPIDSNIYSLFTGTTKEELLEFLDNFRYNTPFKDEFLLSVSDTDNTSSMNICGNCFYHSELKEENIIMPCINCSEKNGWVFKGKICLGGCPYADSDGNTFIHIENSPEDLAAIIFNQKTPPHQEILELLPSNVANIYQELLDKFRDL